MLSKSITAILDRLDKLHAALAPVLDTARRVERIEAKLDQLLTAQSEPAQTGKPPEKRG